MSNYHVQSLHGPVLRPRVSNPVPLLIAAIRSWQQRYEIRRHLLEMDQHLLEDIGLSRAEARLEAAKPFWKN